MPSFCWFHGIMLVGRSAPLGFVCAGSSSSSLYTCFRSSRLPAGSIFLYQLSVELTAVPVSSKYFQIKSTSQVPSRGAIAYSFLLGFRGARPKPDHYQLGGLGQFEPQSVRPGSHMALVGDLCAVLSSGRDIRFKSPSRSWPRTKKVPATV